MGQQVRADVADADLGGQAGRGALVVSGEQDRGGAGYFGDPGDGGRGSGAGAVRDGQQRGHSPVYANHGGGLPAVLQHRDAGGSPGVGLAAEQVDRAADLDAAATGKGADAAPRGGRELVRGGDGDPGRAARPSGCWEGSRRPPLPGGVL